MKFQVGDQVIIVPTGEEGEVIRIIDKNMILVSVNGVEFPVYKDQLEFPYFKRFTEKKQPDVKKKVYLDQLKPEKKMQRVHEVEEGLWLEFLPVFDKDIFDEDIVDFFKLYVVNQTPIDYQFTYRQHAKQKVAFELKNELRAGQDFYLHNVSLEDMNDSPRFEFEWKLAEPDKRKVAYYETSVKVKAKQLFEQIEKLLIEQKAFFSYLLMKEYPEAPPKEKQDLHSLSKAGIRVTSSQHSMSSVRSVIDLHIEKITSSTKGMSNYEILSLQLNEFEKFCDAATAHYQPSLIVIHGVGEGVLRDEIHERLRFRKEVKSFVNQYHPLYGYGATEIYFQY
jgi:hypothetical protein